MILCVSPLREPAAVHHPLVWSVLLMLCAILVGGPELVVALTVDVWLLFVLMLLAASFLLCVQLPLLLILVELVLFLLTLQVLFLLALQLLKHRFWFVKHHPFCASGGCSFAPSLFNRGLLCAINLTAPKLSSSLPPFSKLLP